MSFSFSLSQDRTYIDWSFSVLVRVFTFRVQLESGPHLYRLVMFLSLFVFSLSRDRTYIDRSFFVLVQVFGAAPISIGHLLIILSIWVWVGTAPISIGHHLVSSSSVRVSGPHLYRSVIVLSDWVESCSSPSHSCIFESSLHYESPLFLHFGCSESFSPLGYLELTACSSLLFWISFPLHMTQSFEIRDAYFDHVVGHPTLGILV